MGTPRILQIASPRNRFADVDATRRACSDLLAGVPHCRQNIENVGRALRLARHCETFTYQGSQHVFVSASTRCFSELDFWQALTLINDLEFEKIK